jgi:DNA-binding response OmpR family regulator
VNRSPELKPARGRLVAVVDDEPDIRELVSLHLTKAGFKTSTFADGDSFYRFTSDHVPDLVVLDLMLPDIDGIEICKHLKADSRLGHVPVVMLTARAEETDRVLGLELGADDYVTKPFSPRELVARVRAVLRRNEKRAETRTIELPEETLIDLDRYEVTVAGRRVELTTTEFKLFAAMAERRGWVFSRDDLLDRLWGSEKSVVDRTIDVHIANLRKKLKKAGRLIHNVRGVGYKVES